MKQPKHIISRRSIKPSQMRDEVHPLSMRQPDVVCPNGVPQRFYSSNKECTAFSEPFHYAHDSLDTHLQITTYQATPAFAATQFSLHATSQLLHCIGPHLECRKSAGQPTVCQSYGPTPSQLSFDRVDCFGLNRRGSPALGDAVLLRLHDVNATNQMLAAARRRYRPLPLHANSTQPVRDAEPVSLNSGGLNTYDRHADFGL
jgi:hypothetical protein